MVGYPAKCFMKILVITSRYTATRDIIKEDFGRQTRLFEALRKFKHEIHFFCADYKRFENKNTSLHGIKVFIRPFGAFYFFNFVSELKKTIKREKYDLIIATSDPLWGSIGYFISKKYKIRFLYDLHDNYETYATYKIPFFKYLDNFIIKNSDLVTTVSYSLKNKIKSIREKNVFVIQNGVDTSLFKPLNKNKCKGYLKLPKNAKIIAYTGSLQRTQGVDLLIEAFNSLKKEIPNLHLLIAGRFLKGEERYINLKHKGIIYKGGSLPQKDIIKVINSADVAVIPNTLNNFAKYCFPYKVVEYMACNAPIVATDVGDVGRILSTYKNSLCRPNDIEDMKNKIKKQLKMKKANYRKTAEKNSWRNIAKKLDSLIRQ